MTHATQRVPQWRKLGKPVGKAMTAQEAIKLGGLDFTVRVSEDPVNTTVNGKTISVDSKFMTYADIPGNGLTALGVVGNRYTPIQNSEAFDLLNNIVDESGANFDSAGIVGNGRKCYITMKLPNTIQVAGGADSIDTYLNCFNSHDGSSSFKIQVTFLRLVCTNGMTRMIGGESITLRHTSNATLKVAEAREALGVVFAQQHEFEAEIQKMLNIKMTDKQYQSFVEELVPEPKTTDSVRKQNSVENVPAELMGLWRADTQKNVAHTAWAAFSAVTEYVDWVKPVRGRGDDKELLRAERRLTGSSSLKTRAAELLLA